jgi:hypothetical protein
VKHTEQDGSNLGFGMFVGGYPSTPNILIENIRGFP